MGRVRSAAIGAAATACGIAIVELMFAFGGRPLTPIGWPGIGLLIGSALGGRLASISGAVVFCGYLLLELARPERFPAFFDAPFNPLASVLVLVALGGATGWLSERTAALRQELAARRGAEAALRESEARFRSLAELSSDWYWELDEELRFVHVPDDAAEKPHLRPAGFIGKRRWELSDTSLTREQWAEHRAQLERHEEFRDLEYSRLSHDGKLRWVRVSGRPVFDGAGGFRGYRGVGRDITAQKLAEQALRASEAQLRAIFERSNAGIALIGADRCFLAVNAGYANFVGWGAEELVGRDTEMVRCPEDQEGRATFGRMVAGEIGSLLRDRCYVRKDGRRVWGRLSMTAVRDASGAPQYFVVVVTDVTEARLARERIERMNEELERRVAERTAALQATLAEVEAFSYTISHDLRAPLRAINGFARLLRDEEAASLSDEGKRLLQVVEKNARDMAALVDGLLEFSRLGRQSLAHVRVHVRRLVDELIAEHGVDGAQIRVVALPDCDGDPLLVRQVWANLVANALKYSRSRTPPVIELGYDSGQAAYYVRDNGIGFDMQYADKLFGVFQRLHNDPEYEGTGVGLAIVNRIVHRHGGRVWAEARPGEGATFYFTLGSGQNAPS